MSKKFWISGIAATLVAFVLEFLVHGFILAGDYKPLMGTLMRTEEASMGLFHFMAIAHIILGFGAAWIYLQGVKETPWLVQGVRFGIAMACVTAIPMFMIFYVVLPEPGMLRVKQMALETIVWIIVGIVLAFINKK